MEKINAIALSMLPHISLVGLNELYQQVGSATDILSHRHDMTAILPVMPKGLRDDMAAIDTYLKRAEEELQWAEQNNIRVLTLADADFPQRLRECSDAPTVLYYRGNADLNARRTLAVIGTRQCTAYGKDIIAQFISELKALVPDALILSGLAYGVDIYAHRESLSNGLPTVGVLAHGLDQIYPQVHRDTAVKMLANGGLLTEYPSKTKIDKRNFVQRNRIVAGMADATILVESAEKGGGLITLSIARDYNRDTFAFPGMVGAPYSKGCNEAIRDHKAQLITSAEDFVMQMGWDEDGALVEAKSHGIERSLFPDLTPEEQRIVDVLAKDNDLQINILTAKTGLPVNQLSSLLFTMEMNGIVRMMAGGIYHLIG